MTGTAPDWLREGRGIAPHMRWSFTTDAPLVSMSLGRECGELVASDMTGGAYRLDRRGQIQALSRGLHGLRKLAWNDDGSGGAGIIGSGLLVRMNPRMDVVWSTELRQDILDVATDPFGHYVAASLADGDVVVFDRNKKRIARFQTVRPLSFLRFIAAERGIVGAAEHGLLCRYELNGTQRWSERLWSNVGDLAVTGNGDLNLLAGFNLGIQTFDADGASLASFVLDGTVKRIAPSDTADRMAAATVETQVYWLDSDGEMLWAAQADEAIEALACDPLGEWLVCGFQSGRIMRLDWDSASAG